MWINFLLQGVFDSGVGVANLKGFLSLVVRTLHVQWLTCRPLAESFV